MKKITIIMVLLLCALVLFGCKKEEKESQKDADSIRTEDTVEDTLGSTNNKEEQTVVEDEVNMSENTTDKTQATPTIDADDVSDSVEDANQNSPNDTEELEGDVTSNPSINPSTGDEEDADTSDKQRYDKDGDGFVDGWY